MKIAVLIVDNERSNSSISELEPVVNPFIWLNGYEAEKHLVTKDNYYHKITQHNFDIALNLCDGAEGENRPGIEIVHLLEKLNIPFTGAASDFYEPSREAMKISCFKSKINYPRSILIERVDDDSQLNEIVFPSIVKHPNSYNSIGLTRDSVVYNYNDLMIQLKRMLEMFGSALIEEYIDGNEYTALVVENPENNKEPIVFTPMQIVFPEGERFKHFDLKWARHSSMKYIPVDNEKISETIKRMSSDMFLEMKGSGYARCDLRANSNGDLFMLEINPNCSIYFPKDDPSSADEILFAETDGHRKFTELILKNAYKRVKH